MDFARILYKIFTTFSSYSIIFNSKHYETFETANRTTSKIPVNQLQLFLHPLLFIYNQILKNQLYFCVLIHFRRNQACPYLKHICRSCH